MKCMYSPRRWQNNDVAFLMDSALLKEEGGWGLSDLVEKQGLYLMVQVCSVDRTHIAPAKGFSPLLF